MRKMSTHCGKCKIAFDETLSNKAPKRALCLECFEADSFNRNKEKRKYDRDNRVNMDRIEKYKNYKVSVRAPFWKQINNEIKPLSKREEIKAFIAKQMDRILADQQLMDYINDTNIIERDI